MTQLEPQDIMELERRDEQQILAEIQGKVIDEMVYRFTSGGRQVVGISWVGIKELARQYGRIDVELLELRETEDAWIAVVKARDTERGNGMLGVSTQPKTMETRKGPQPDPFALQKAMSKAQRNAIRALIPETFMKTVIQEWLSQQQRGEPRPPVKPRRDAIAEELQALGLDPTELHVEEKPGRLTIKPHPSLSPEDWKRYDQVFSKHGRWIPAKQAWEVRL